MSQDFSKAKIYKITNDYNDDVYVGSTCNTLAKRFSDHKSHCMVEPKTNLPLYKLINEIGFERFRIQLIEIFPCDDKYELRQREGHFIRQIGTLNKRVAGRTKKEYYMEFKEEKQDHKKEVQKEYYEQNKDVINEKRTEKISCECGSVIMKCNLLRHTKNIKHIALMAEKTNLA